jgi:hypothetical protein
MMLLLVILPALVAATARDEAIRRGYTTRVTNGQVVPTPYLFFYEQQGICPAGFQACRAELANYDNQIKTYTFIVTGTGAGKFVNYPTNILANDKQGSCDTYAIAGNLGFAGVKLQKSSANWTNSGNTGYLMQIINPTENDVLTSCGFDQNAPGQPFPGCPNPPPFYQFVGQFAYQEPLNVTIQWTITSIDQNTYSGTTTCVLNPNQPNFTVPVETSVDTTTSTTAPTTTSTTVPTTTTTTVPTTTTTTRTTTTVPTTTTTVTSTTTVPPTTTTTVVQTTSPNCQANLYQVCDQTATRPCCSNQARCARHFKSCQANQTGILGQSNWLCIPIVLG